MDRFTRIRSGAALALGLLLFAVTGGGVVLAGSSGNHATVLHPSTCLRIKPACNIALPTTTALASSVNPSRYGQSVTFTATVLSSAPVAPGRITPHVPGPDGNVTFTDGGATLCATRR
jgi:hypothetical protein